MMQANDPANLPLRDIHLPDPISWWPIAPGWWMASLLLVILVCLCVYLIHRYRHHKISALYLAKEELEKIKIDFEQQQDKRELVKALSELIRRISISVFRRQEVAGLTGKEWLVFLDRYSGNNEFNEGIGRVLIEAPYQAKPDFNSSELIELVSAWIEVVNKQHKGARK